MPDPFAKLKPTDTALTIATVISDHLLSLEPARGPYRVAINHDVSAAGCRAASPRPGSHGCGACPLDYEWQHDRVVGITATIPRVAQRWIIGALLKGYTVTRFDRRGWSPIGDDNIEQVRRFATRRAERVALTPAQRKALDDEIPF